MSTEKRRAWERQWRRQWNKDNPIKRLLHGARKRAKAQGLPCTIAEQDIIIPTHCPYLGIELTITAKRGDNRSNVYSLDKIIPELGYIPGNIEVISHLANTMKSNATEEQLVRFATTILNRYPQGTY